ncbi:hypothetical protein PO124_04155 [Bacillus licheniformis]|nr:hypothetical protein [Bacillus licheniformis]
MPTHLHFKCTVGESSAPMETC